MHTPPLDRLLQLRVNAERLYADFLEIQAIGLADDGSLDRVALSPQDVAARQWFASRIEEAGLTVRDDDAGNMSGVLPSRAKRARTLLVGSHLDSVANGGHYDGVIGVLAALECLRALKEADADLPVNVEAIDFTDDEGTFMGMFGCRALAGALPPDALSDSGTADYGAFRAAMIRAGMQPSDYYKARRDPANLAGYVELHIEQGPRLERGDKQIGVVLGIVGRTNYEITFNGEAGHSGTTDMYRRRDALRGAAQFIMRMHELVRERFGDGIFNCGNIQVYPGNFNVIPSRATLAVEVRHVDTDLLNSMETAVISTARECAATFRLDVIPRLIVRFPAAAMHPSVISAIKDSCEDLCFSHTDLYSYSGHSPQFLSAVTPSGMIFIPSIGGISHHRDERTDWNDVVNGANVLLNTLVRLALVHEGRGSVARRSGDLRTDHSANRHSP
ncbi:MAG: Zn-dependent hydrolase [Anaerolineae bacterium]|nr:Zn-dependent hydrolase [Anaerolineae bacterium]